MYNRKTMLALAGVALVLAGTLYLAPALAYPYWYQSAEDGETVPPYFSHCYVNGTWTRDENGTLQPPCWDPETGEYVPRNNGTRPSWCPYSGGQTGQGTGGLGGMMQGFGGGLRRGGGCGRTG